MQNDMNREHLVMVEQKQANIDVLLHDSCCVFGWGWISAQKVPKPYFFLLITFQIDNVLLEKFLWVSRVICDSFNLGLLCSVIGPENLHHSLNHSDVKL